MNNLRRFTFTTKIGNNTRLAQSNASLLENCNEINNRNPRNLEFMKIAKKPVGYYLDKPGRSYWNKLSLTVTKRHVKAEIHHFKNGPVVAASTEEWALKKQLFKTLDVAAFKNVGRLLAQRSLESGITEIQSDIDTTGSERLASLIEGIKSEGLILQEPAVYVHRAPQEKLRMIKPWTIHE